MHGMVFCYFIDSTDGTNGHWVGKTMQKQNCNVAPVSCTSNTIDAGLYTGDMFDEEVGDDDKSPNKSKRIKTENKRSGKNQEQTDSDKTIVATNIGIKKLTNKNIKEAETVVNQRI